MSAAVELDRVGVQYGTRWALQDCTLVIPPGHVVGLFGTNGAGKTTLLNLAVGLLAPTSGALRVLGAEPGDDAAHLARIGFVAQETPLYARTSVADHLRLGAWLNPSWDAALAEARVRELRLDPGQRAGSLSAGERAQLALALAIAKRPELLLLDEPVASLDPLARQEFLQRLMEIVATDAISVVLSSHLVLDLERVCDFAVVLSGGRVQLAGEVSSLLACHHRLYGTGRNGALPSAHEIVEQRHTPKQSSLLVRTEQPVLDPTWTVEPVSLDELVLAYMRRGRDTPPTPQSTLAAIR